MSTVMLLLLGLLSSAAAHGTTHHTCELQTQFYVPDSDTFEVGHLRVNHEILVTWQGDNPGEDMQCSGLDVNCCEMFTRTIRTDSNTNFLDDLSNAYYSVPMGGFFMCASMDRLDELNFPSGSSPEFDHLLDQMGIGRGSLEEDDSDYFNNNQLPRSWVTDVEGYTLITQKAANAEGIYKQTLVDFGARTVTAYYDVDDELGTEHCVTELPPFNMLTGDKWGMADVTTGKEDWAAINMNDPIGCDGHIRGWVVYSDTGRDFYADVYSKTRDGDNEVENLRHEHKKHIDPPSPSQPLEPYVVCEASPIPVQKGSHYGYHYDDDSGSGDHSVAIAHAYNHIGGYLQYPCAEVPTWNTVSQILLFQEDENGNDFDNNPVFVVNNFHREDVDMQSVQDCVIYAHMGLRPIMREDFVYGCGCSNNDYCRQYDKHMRCEGNKCQCVNQYIYNYHHNRCIDPVGVKKRPASASSVASGSDADYISDSSDDTCYYSNTDDNLWVTIDMGVARDVYAVTLTPPKAYSTMGKLFTNGASGAPDEYVFDDFEDGLTGSNYRTFSTCGPWAWLVTLEDGETILVNEAQNEDERDYNFNDRIESVQRIGSAGPIYCGGECFEKKGGHIELSDPGEEDDCADFFLLETQSASGTEFQLWLADEDKGLHFDSLTHGDDIELDKDPSPIVILTAFGAPPLEKDAALTDSSIVIASAADNGVCVGGEPGERVTVKTNADCLTCFLSQSQIINDRPTYHYDQVDADDIGTAVFSSAYSDIPCIQVIDEENPNTGIVVLSFPDNNRVEVQGVTMDTSDSEVSQLVPFNLGGTNLVTICSTDTGLRDFTITVTDVPPGGNPVIADDTVCTSYPGYSPPNVETIFQCDKPLKGRYVTIRTEHAGARISLCDVNIHMVPCAYYGLPCDVDLDCLKVGENGDKYSLNMECRDDCMCHCKDGFFYFEPSDTCRDIDECDEEWRGDNDCYCPGANTDSGKDAHGTCKNTIGSYECMCPDGYERSTCGCTDIDETAYNNCGCHDRCENRYLSTDGMMFECYCDGDGFRKAKDGLACVDINECEENPNICGSGVCYNHYGYYKCHCGLGKVYNHTVDVMDCVDIDECTDTTYHPYNGGCEDKCINHDYNTDSLRYECTCDNYNKDQDLFKIGADGHSCVRYDTCLSDSSNKCRSGSSEEFGSNAPVTKSLCEVHIHDDVCVCLPGYKLDKATYNCVDINECASHNHCEQICINTYGYYDCDCSEGFSQYNNYFCMDVDECHADYQGEMKCKQYSGGNTHDAICVNLPGKYECKCPDGSNLLDTYTCVDNNECEYKNGGCEVTCVNQNIRVEQVTHRCECPENYMLASNGVSCIDIDECLQPGMCTGGAQCKNQYPAYACACPFGYEYLDGRCVDVDECVVGMAACPRDRCVNTQGSYYCDLGSGGPGDCLPGYTREANGACFDINECLTASACVGCINTPGSYICSGIGGDGVRASGCLSIPWRPELGVLPSPDAMDDNLADYVQRSLVGFGISSVSVTRFYPTGNNVVGFDLSVHSPSSSSASEQARLAEALAGVFRGSGIIHNGAGFGCEPSFNMPGSSVPVYVRSACDYLYPILCQPSGKVCIETTTQAYCRCPNGYTGQMCQEPVTIVNPPIRPPAVSPLGLEDWEIALLATMLSLLGVGILLCCLCVLCREGGLCMPRLPFGRTVAPAIQPLPALPARPALPAARPSYLVEYAEPVEIVSDKLSPMVTYVDRRLPTFNQPNYMHTDSMYSSYSTYPY